MMMCRIASDKNLKYCDTMADRIYAVIIPFHYNSQISLLKYTAKSFW